MWLNLKRNGGSTCPDSVHNEAWNIQMAGEMVYPSDPPDVSLGKGAFFDCAGLIDVTIPEGVTGIGDSAFYGCTACSSPAP